MVFQYYEYFYKVAQLGSITKAAMELFVTQPALSKAIGNLEKELGFPLFDRTAKGMKLTEEGDLFYQNVRQAFALLNETENKINLIREQKLSYIRIGVGRDLFEKYLLNKLSSFSQMYPDVHFRLDIASTNVIEEALSNGEIDIGITPRPLSNRFVFKRDLFPLYNCFIVGEKYKNLTQEPNSVYSLMNYPLIMLPKDSLSRIYADSIFSSFGLTANPVYELKDTQLISLLVHHNFGIGFVTENFVEDAIQSGHVYKVPTIEKFPNLMATLTWNDTLSLSSSARSFVEYLHEDR